MTGMLLFASVQIIYNIKDFILCTLDLLFCDRSFIYEYSNT